MKKSRFKKNVEMEKRKMDKKIFDREHKKDKREMRLIGPSLMVNEILAEHKVRYYFNGII